LTLAAELERDPKPGRPRREFSKWAQRPCGHAQLRWNDLRYFLAIHRQRTLAGAARSLRVQHSTVGRRLGGLENTLGASLFTQTPDGFVLTDAGREILPLAEEAERALTAIERRVAGSDERVEGVVRLTTSEAFSGFLVRHLSELRRRHPDLLVEVLAGNRSLDLARGEADVALRISATTQPELICKRIGDAAWSLYASEGYLARHGKPVSPTDLAGHEIIGFDESLSATPGAQWFAEHAASARIMLRGNSIPAVINAAIVGLGLAMVPCFLADAEPTLRRVTPDVLGSREIWLVFHPDVARIARVRRVIDFVTEIIGRAAPQLRGVREVGADAAYFGVPGAAECRTCRRSVF
jgi:DNA-binding transcriptional LysR family regulator